MIRFAIHPGYVRSPNDGDRHFVDASSLMDLYGVRPHECVVVDARNPEIFLRALGVDTSKLLNLYPSDQGAAYWRISDVERRQYPLEEAS